MATISNERLSRWILTWPRSVRLIVEALTSAVLFYSAALFSHNVATVAELEPGWLWGLHAASFLFVFTVVVFLFLHLSRSIDAIRKRQEHQKSTIAHAYQLMDRLLVDHSTNLETCDADPHRVGLELSCSLKRIQSIIAGAYHVFESAYGRHSLSDDRVDFEVTFMTKSLKDNQITIPAAANRDARQPRSMELRKKHSGIYDNTVTAELYRMERPAVRVISITAVPTYHEVYTGQKERIKSSIVFPVLSNMNRLLGTIVVHCDREQFFTERDKKYWSDLLEVFAKRIAIEAILAEIFVALSRESSAVVIGPLEEPPY